MSNVNIDRQTNDHIEQTCSRSFCCSSYLFLNREQTLLIHVIHILQMTRMHKHIDTYSHVQSRSYIIRKSGKKLERGLASNGMISTGLNGGPDIFCVILSPPDRLNKHVDCYVSYLTNKSIVVTHRVDVKLANECHD
jgi:hypothetical protein